VTIATRFSDTGTETGTPGTAATHSDSLLRATDLSKPEHFGHAKDSKNREVRVAATTPQGDKPADKTRGQLDPNNEKQFTDFAAKELRSQFGLRSDASSKDFVDGYVGAAVGNYRNLRTEQQELVGKLNGLDPHKTYTDQELKGIFTDNLKAYHQIEKGPDQDQKLEGAILHEMFQQNQDLQKLRKFYEEDHKKTK
jgi:hypothetical protein